jgi:hypothetical protein
MTRGDRILSASFAVTDPGGVLRRSARAVGHAGSFLESRIREEAAKGPTVEPRQLFELDAHLAVLRL